MSQNVTKIDYSKGLIYKLCCKDPEIKEIYIGSTTNFRQRKYGHNTACNNINTKKYNLNLYKFIRENGGFENWDMILIQYYSCANKKELEAKEREYIETLKQNINCKIPGRTKKEYSDDNKDKKKLYDKQYQQNNKYKIKKRRKDYYENNKDKININLECEYCKSIVKKYNLLKHQRTKKCLQLRE